MTYNFMIIVPSTKEYRNLKSNKQYQVGMKVFEYVLFINF